MNRSYESIVMYKSWLEIARKNLSDDDANRVMVQIMEYGFTGKESVNDNPLMNVILDMAKPNIDSNIVKKENGRKGGRKSRNKTTETDGKTSGLSNANGNANVNGNANGNGNDNGTPAPSASAPLDGGRALGQSDEEGWVKY